MTGTEQKQKTPNAAAGSFAMLRGLVGLKGIGASSERASRARDGKAQAGASDQPYAGLGMVHSGASTIDAGPKTTATHATEPSQRRRTILSQSLLRVGGGKAGETWGTIAWRPSRAGDLKAQACSSADGHYAEFGCSSAASWPKRGFEPKASVSRLRSIDQCNRLTPAESSMGPAPQGSANVVVSVYERARNGGRPEVSGCERSPEPPKKHSRQESRGTKRVRAVSRTTAITIMSLLMIALTGGTAQAAITHKFESTPTKAISEHAATCTGPGSLTGALGGVNALTVDGGHLWLAESLGEAGERVDQLSASTGACEQQLEATSLVNTTRGVAVGHVTGEREVYVGAFEDHASKTLAVMGVFGPSGALQSMWTGKATPGGAFAHLPAEPVGQDGGHVIDVAVDGSTNAGTAGDVYVADEGQRIGVVYVFKPEAALKGAEPASVVAELTGACENTGEVATGVLACAGSSRVPFESLENQAAVAVDPGNGDVLVANGGGEGRPAVVDVFEPTGLGEYTYLRQITGISNTQPFRSIGALAVGGGAENGDVYVAEDGATVAYQFDHEGVFLGSVEGTPSGPFLDVASLAIDPASGDLFVGDDREAHAEPGVVDVFGSNLVVPDVTTEAASAETPRSATLNGRLSALEARTGEAAECRFLWGRTEALEEAPVPCEQNPVEGEETPVTAKLGEQKPLAPDTTYYYRLQASNKKGTNNNGAILHFTTTGPGILSASVSKVAATSATLNATLEPHGAATSYRFEYDTKPYGPAEAAHGTAVPVPDEAIGSTPGEVKVQQHIQNLGPATTYYYRVVTVGEIEGNADEFDGEGHTFTTQGAGEFALPDHRQYEMVSPPNKDGAMLDGLGGTVLSEGYVIQAAADGDAITYVASAPTEPEPAGYSNETQVFSARGSEGTWQTRDLTVLHAGATDGSVGFGLEYRFFGEDLSSAIVQPFGPFIALSTQASEATAYLQNLTNGAYTPLVTHTEGVANDTAEPFQPFGQLANLHGVPCPPALICGPYFLGATSDDKHAVLESDVALTEPPLPENPATHKVPPQLYEWNGAEPPSRQLRLVSLLPPAEGGGPPAAGAQLGAAAGAEASGDARGAISSDGSRVFWFAGHALYMRDVATEKTLRLDLPEAACATEGTCGRGTAAARFQVASSDGSRVLFTDAQRLTAGSGALGADLYECKISEFAGEPKCELVDLTPRSATGESASVQGAVLGEGEDGSYIYFVAEGKLAEGAVPGEPSLYLRHGGVTRLVAVLSSEDFPDWAGGGAGGALNTLTARVSPNGRYLAFMSDQALTGYDNRDAQGYEHEAIPGTNPVQYRVVLNKEGQPVPAPDEEVYEYDATNGRTSCVSCDPSGARPVGIYTGPQEHNAPLVGNHLSWAERWLAAYVPGWTPFENQVARYESRYLSNTGRLFFNGRSALVPNDVNNQWDVYEYEPESVGDCNSNVSTGSRTYKHAHLVAVEGRDVEEAPGCVGLISNGESKDESAFLDASETGGEGPHGEELQQGGGDVFFLTTSKLTPQDVDDSYDIYDAHECTSESPCSQPATSPPPCTTEASCKASPTPQPSIYGPPASATFSGPGNLTPAPVVPPKKVVKKAARCKSGFVRRTVKPKHGKAKSECVRKPKPKKQKKK